MARRGLDSPLSDLLSRAAVALRQERPLSWTVGLWLMLVTSLAVLSWLAAHHDSFGWDLELTKAVQRIDSMAFERLSRAATDSSSHYIPAWLVATSLLLMLRRPRFAFFAAASGWTHVLGGILKLLVDRPRPSADLIETVRLETKFSFPSGHAEWVMGFEGFLVFLVWQSTRNPLLRSASLLAWFAHLAFTGIGRVDQGLHWPSDVLAGYLVGAVALILTIWAFRLSLRMWPADARPSLIPDSFRPAVQTYRGDQDDGGDEVRAQHVGRPVGAKLEPGDAH